MEGLFLYWHLQIKKKHKHKLKIKSNIINYKLQLQIINTNTKFFPNTFNWKIYHIRAMMEILSLICKEMALQKSV